jgi:hypothetical protein
LRIGELGARRLNVLGVIRSQVGKRGRVFGVDGAVQIFGLMPELIQAGPDGQFTRTA